MHSQIKRFTLKETDDNAQFVRDIYYSKLGALRWVQNCSLYVIWLILVMICWEWPKTYHLLTRYNFAPNLQHLIYYSKYLNEPNLKGDTANFKNIRIFVGRNLQ